MAHVGTVHIPCMDAMGSIFESINLAIESLKGIVPDGWLVMNWLLLFVQFATPQRKT